MMILELFKRYDAMHPMASGTSGPKVMWVDGAYADPAQLVDFLGVTSTLDEMVDVWARNEAVLLRPYRQEKTLVVGCGNKPVAFSCGLIDERACALYPNYAMPIDIVDDFRANHCHVGEYTWNPDIGMNPSVVGRFGDTDATAFLPAHCFTQIIFEGVCFEDTPLVPSVIERLLAPNGIMCASPGNKILHMEDYIGWAEMCTFFWG